MSEKVSGCFATVVQRSQFVIPGGDWEAGRDNSLEGGMYMLNPNS